MFPRELTDGGQVTTVMLSVSPHTVPCRPLASSLCGEWDLLQSLRNDHIPLFQHHCVASRISLHPENGAVRYTLML